MAAEKFIADFHSLPGTTLGEVKKSFNNLLNANATLDATILGTITQNLQPNTYMERLLKVDFLIHFRRSTELLHLFRESTDGAILHKIFKQDWFFLERFQTLASVQDILLDLGFCTRMRFLNRLSRLAPFFDEVFDMILARYGLIVARKFILGCSTMKLREVITNYKVKLTAKELKNIYRKDKNFVEFYFEIYVRKFKENPSTKEYGRVLQFIAEDDLELYLTLIAKSYFKNCHGYYQLGSRLTAKVTRNFRTTGKENHTECLKDRVYMRKSSMVNRKKVLKKLCCDQENKNLNAVIRLLKKSFPQKHRYEILVEVVGDLHKGLIYPEILELVPIAQERARLANLMLGGLEDEIYIKYLEIDEALSQYKELINVSSQIYRRAELIEAMVEACSISKSLPALKSVMDYFLMRHRNDDEIMHSSFSCKIEQLFSLEEFDDILWDKYREILNISEIKYETSPSAHVCLTFIKHKYKNQCDISELVQNYWKTHPNVFNIADCGEALETFINISLAMNDSHVNEQIMRWLLLKHGPKKLYSHPSLVDLFKSMLDQELLMLSHLSKLVFDMKFEDRLYYIDIYFRLCVQQEGINWFLKQDPGNLSPERLFSWIAKLAPTKTKPKYKTNWQTWHLVKQYHELSTRTLLQCQVVIPNAKAGQETAMIISVFSLLASFGEYMEVLNSIPATADRPLRDKPSEELRRVYALRREFGRRLKNFEVANETVKTLFDFCKGDYFQSTLPSLLSYAYRFPEKYLEVGILAQLRTRSVTIRKHALFLSLQLRDQVSAKEELLRFVANEKDLTIQKRIYLSITTFLCRSPCDEVFAALLESLKRIRKEDIETIKVVIKIGQIPEQYHTVFFQAVWTHLTEILSNSTDKLKGLKRDLLSNVSDRPYVIAALPYDFILNVTKSFFLSEEQIAKETTRNKEVIYDFLSEAIVNGHEKILDEIFTLVKTSNNNDFFKFSYPKMMRNSPNATVVKMFIQGWNQIFIPVDNFKEFALLVFLRFKSKHLETSVGDFFKAYLEFFDETFEKFGSFILWPLASVTQDILSYFTTEQIREMNYMEMLLKARPGDCRMSMTVIQIVSEMSYQLKQYDTDLLVRLVDLLKSNEDPAVRINCNLYLANKDELKPFWV